MQKATNIDHAKCFNRLVPRLGLVLRGPSTATFLTVIVLPLHEADPAWNQEKQKTSQKPAAIYLHTFFPRGNFCWFCCFRLLYSICWAAMAAFLKEAAKTSPKCHPNQGWTNPILLAWLQLTMFVDVFGVRSKPDLESFIGKYGICTGICWLLGWISVNIKWVLTSLAGKVSS